MLSNYRFQSNQKDTVNGLLRKKGPLITTAQLVSQLTNSADQALLLPSESFWTNPSRKLELV